jgi:hypothetical protein
VLVDAVSDIAAESDVVTIVGVFDDVYLVVRHKKSVPVGGTDFQKVMAGSGYGAHRLEPDSRGIRGRGVGWVGVIPLSGIMSESKLRLGLDLNQRSR